MRALVLAEYKRLELTEMPAPVAGPGEILLRVVACGICGSDVHGFDGSTGRRIPPIVMGHEAAGTVVALGEGVTGFAEGDRVTFDSTVYCGGCAYCRRGLMNLCDNRQIIGVSTPDFRRHGAFSEYVAVPARIVYRLPDSLPFTHAAMLEAISVALHGVALSKGQGNGAVLVVGAGMIGLLTLQALKAEGFPRVFIADIDESRLRLAATLGASATFQAEGLVDQVLAASSGEGVDVAIECVGRDETVRAAIDSVRKGGGVTLVGNIRPEVTLPLQKVVSRQIRLQGSAASSGEYPRAIELLSSGAIRVEPLISAVAPLEEGPRWFERLYAGEPNLMKVVLTPENPHV
ncbi:MAG TPA: galactitol-1-phosphate 5-dehydrogenase [Bryobacteraceae bacterium]|nr:galactitol-1-phosphate 5-dehydrogenase [Bryobacteraceae bacterium]